MISSTGQPGSQFEQNDHHNKIFSIGETNNDKQKVKIYLRKTNKKTVVLNIFSPASYQQVFGVIQKNHEIPVSQLVLFWKGNKIQPCQANSQKLFYFQQNDIIHIHHIKNLKESSINVIIKIYDCPHVENKTFTIQTYSEAKIYSTIKKSIENIDEFVLIESGRKLDMEKTFEEELIQNDSTLVLTSFKEETIKPKCKIANKSTMESSTGFESKQNVNSDVKKPMMKKATSWSFPDQPLACSFKKKEKPSVYISTKNETGKDGKQIIWETDSSGNDLNKHKQINKIAKRKHIQSHNSQQFEEDSQEKHEIIFSDQDDTPIFDIKESQNKFTKQEKIKINQQIHKLLNDTHTNREIMMKSAIQPPHMVSNLDFLEQQDEIQVMMGLDEEIHQNEPDKPIMKPIINLGASIGKSRGTFIPVVPSKDLQDDDNLQDF